MYCSALILVQSFLATAQITFTSNGNPILSDGSYYSADPAPLVVNDTIYILSGRDEAPIGVNNFIMNEWQMFVSTTAEPIGGDWQLHTNIARPKSVFAWAAEGTAYASQMVQGLDGRYYLYSPVTEAASTSSDKFAIGVAVGDGPLGPFKDAHPSGPIISQAVPSPGNNIQNIDPTVLIDDDGRVYLYEGTFGQLRGYEVADDMVTIVSSATSVTTLTGYFEAPWLMKRAGTYYMLYAANNAGENSPCTPTSYHACIAYGTSSSPLGPWTFRGIVLGIVSSTTSHPGVFQKDDTYYIVYHTADAVDGGHFRRSIAFDVMTFDDSQSPPRINKVTQTQRPRDAVQPTRNIAARAGAASINTTPIQYWIASVNDGMIPVNPLPPDYWCSYNGAASPQTSQLVLTWNTTVALNGARMVFFADQPAGSNIGVPPPASWSLAYLNSLGSWTNVSATTAYFTDITDDPREVKFTEIETTALRATLIASGGGRQYGGVGVKEWEALAPIAQ